MLPNKQKQLFKRIQSHQKEVNLIFGLSKNIINLLCLISYIYKRFLILLLNNVKIGWIINKQICCYYNNF